MAYIQVWGVLVGRGTPVLYPRCVGPLWNSHSFPVGFFAREKDEDGVVVIFPPFGRKTSSSAAASSLIRLRGNLIVS